MDDNLQRQLIRQLKLLNFWITTFGVLILVSLGIMLYLLFQAITFVQDASNSIEQFQQEAQDSINLQKQLCDDDSQVSSFLRGQTSICE